MSYHECPKCNGRGTVCAKCGRARTHKRWQRNIINDEHESHLTARIISCSGHQQPWYNCDCCGKERVDGRLYRWANQVFPRSLESKTSNGVGYCGDCASFVRARLEVAFDEAIGMLEK